MQEDIVPYENIDEFYEAVKKAVPEIIRKFGKERVKRTITVPKAFDTVFRRSLRADLLRRYDMELDYNELLVAFAMIGLATLGSESVLKKLCNDLDIIDAYEEVKNQETKIIKRALNP
ncbi:MAG: hypothetical protein ABSF44_06900 [Candidatus Bathyarchaeia archaeon]|jgi:hypothetical protein